MLRWSQTKCRTFRGEGLRVVGWVWVRISSQKIMGEMQSNDPKRVLGERGRIRTCDPCLKRALLYQLSYAPTANAKEPLQKHATLVDYHPSRIRARTQHCAEVS